MILEELYSMNDPHFAQRREQRCRAEEEENANIEIEKNFDNDKTSMEEFDIEVVKKIITLATKKTPRLQRQGEELLQTWEEELHPGAYLDNDEFNKLFKQFEQLKDSNDTPLIQFNKLYSLTKELSDATDEFDNWKNSDTAEELKWQNKRDKF